MRYEPAGTLPDLSDEEKRAIVAEAKERFEYIESVDSDNRKSAREAIRFVWVKGAQWDASIASQRDLDKRPCLEINQLPQFVKQVVNDQRQIRPSIKIKPGDIEASEEVAEIEQGLVRGIEYDSNADSIYDSAFESAVTGGRGYWRVVTDYESERSFDQVIKLQRIPDPDTVRLDPDYVMPDAGDIRYGFVTESLGKEEFGQKHPDAEPASWDGIDEVWIDGDRVIVCDYFRKVYTKRLLVLMRNGTTMWKEDLDKLPMLKPAVIAERETEDCRVEWFKLGGGELIEQIEWKGKIIPIVMCIGDEITTGGKRIFQGLIQRAMDSQRMYNYWQTSATELIALAPRAPWVVAEGQLEGFQTQWDQANTRNFSTLTYKPTTLAGQPVAPPQRTQFAGVPSGIVEQANQCKADLRSTIGIYDPSLGNRSNETSGRAILAREKQGDTATFHFVDNLRRAIQLTGRIIVELIPFVYDTKRALRTVGEDGEQELVTVNEPDPLHPEQIKNNLKLGEYKVIVDVGPSYATKRQEAAESMTAYMQANPAAAPLIGDLVARNMDWPGAEQIADRLKLMLPPHIQQAEQGAKGQDPRLAQMAQQLQSVMQQGQQAVQQVQQQAQQAMQQTQEELQRIAGENMQLKARLASREGETAVKAMGIQADAANNEQKNRLADRQFVAETLLELLNMQQQQLQPIGPEAAGLQDEAAQITGGA